MHLHIFDNAEALAIGASRRIAEWLRDGATTLGLAGGSTPRTTYGHLRHEDLPWDRITAWLPDERWVPPGHPDRNATMTKEALFDHVPARLLEVPWGDDPHRAATEYLTTLTETLPTDEDGHLRPDVVLLGMGGDGHTASLFPGTPAVEERDQLYVANWVPAQHTWRLTATLPLLWAARHIVFIIAGATKAKAVRAVLQGGVLLPAARTIDGEADVHWLLDHDAASMLRP